MKEILIVYSDRIFLDFIKSFLEPKNLIVKTATNGLEGIRIAKAEIPSLLILDKHMKGIELDGFLIKKSLIPALKDIPVFLIGDFKSDELKTFKEENIKAFISTPINPGALLERIYLFFNMPLPEINKNTPMLVDMHNKGNIIIIQIEGNFEVDKLEILNYEIRKFCIQKKIKKPKILLIVPSLYPESITKDNIDILFKFLNFEEIIMANHQVKILSQCAPFLDLLSEDEVYKNFEIVVNFIDGVQKLNLDFDNKKEIHLIHLKEGSSYIFDLYDDTGMVRIPALTKVTKEMIEYLIKTGEKKFTYFSETALEEVDNKDVVSSKTAQQNLEAIISDYEEIDEEYDMVRKLDDKMNLFFRKLKGSDVLVISNNKSDNSVILKVLSPYVKMDFLDSGQTLPDIKSKKYIIIFIDMQITNPDVFDLLKRIRSQVSKQEATVIIMSKFVSLDVLDKLKKSGTDNVLLSPFSTSEVMKKVFNSVSSDRGL